MEVFLVNPSKTKSKQSRLTGGKMVKSAYTRFMAKKLKEYGGGPQAMKKASAEWRSMKKNPRSRTKTRKTTRRSSRTPARTIVYRPNPAPRRTVRKRRRNPSATRKVNSTFNKVLHKGNKTIPPLLPSKWNLKTGASAVSGLAVPGIIGGYTRIKMKSNMAGVVATGGSTLVGAVVLKKTVKDKNISSAFLLGGTVATGLNLLFSGLRGLSGMGKIKKPKLLDDLDRTVLKMNHRFKKMMFAGMGLGEVDDFVSEFQTKEMDGIGQVDTEEIGDLADETEVSGPIDDFFKELEINGISVAEPDDSGYDLTETEIMEEAE